MSQTEHVIYIVRRTLDDEIQFFQPLLYPELSRLTYSESASSVFEAKISSLAERTPPELFHLRTMPEEPQLGKVMVSIDPPKSMRESRKWLEPLELSFDYATFTRKDDMTVATVPALGLSVLRRGNHDGNFIGQVKNEIRSALIRNDLLTDYKDLVWISRYEDIEIHRSTLSLEILSPKQLELRRMAEDDKESTLKKVALPLEIERLKRLKKKKESSPSPLIGERMYEYDEEVKKLAEFLDEPNRKSVLLVGPAGVGKTSMMREFAAQKRFLGLEDLECWATDGSRIVAGMSGFGQWQERCAKIVAELKKKKAVLHLGNLVELLEVGKSTTQVDGIASYLRTFIQRGTLQATAECTVEQLALIEQADPQLLPCFQRLDIKVPDREKSLRIFKKASQRFATTNQVKVSDESLDVLYRIHRRYATYSDHPGRSLRFLRNLIQDAPRKHLLTSEDVIRAFSSETGLPYFLLSEKESLNLEDTRKWFAARVIGQEQPVELVTDLLAAVKSNLTPMGRPIASFLFIGPTGVGKTQMAKSLAEYMYQDGRRLIRFDMSEYNDRLSVERLIGGLGQPQGLLTSKVRQHPFSVVLFDEFEKAHPAFYDLLLQVLGEGRLTDGRGRTTDFSTSIIVMTSNLGVSSFRSSGFGFGAEDSSESDTNQQFKGHFEKAVEKFVRPEMFNRIDRIVPFLPLSEETVRAVVKREISQLRKREGIWFRGVDLQVDQTAIELIAKSSRDVRYGARPIQRYLQQNVAVPLADRLLRYASTEEVRAQVSAEDDRLKFDVKSQEGASKKSKVQPVKNTANSEPAIDLDSEVAGENPLFDLVGEPKAAITQNYSHEVSSLRKQRLRAQKLYHSTAAKRIRYQYFREKQMADRRIKRMKKENVKDSKNGPSLEAISYARSQFDADLQLKADRLEDIESTLRYAFDTEDELLEAFFQKVALPIDEVKKKTESLRAMIGETIYRLFLAESEGSNRVSLLAYSRHPELLKEVIGGYLKYAKEKEFSVRAYAIRRFQKEDNRGAVFSLGRVKNEGEEKAPMIADLFNLEIHETMFDDPPKDLLGYGLGIRGPAAFSIFSHERGLHSFKSINRKSVAIEAIGGKIINHELPACLETLTWDEFPFRRQYHQISETIRDTMISSIEFDPKDLAAAVADCVRRCFDKVIADYIQ